MAGSESTIKIMHLRRSRQQFTAALTALVMLFTALAPTVAGALEVTSPMMWVELCSADGGKKVVLDTSSPASGDERSATQHLTEHCPFCHIEQAPLAFPPAPQPFIPHLFAHSEFPALFYAAPRPLHAWAPALSRAPPQHA